jgi:hypothetical protein
MQNQREGEIKPVVVHNRADIELALKPFLTEGHQLRQSLQEGMAFVENRRAFNARSQSGLDVDAMRCWVDELIRQRLGGRREGLTVVWTLDCGKFRYDPQNGRLEEVMDA